MLSRKEICKRYYQNHKAEIAAQCKKYRDEHKEQTKAYREKYKQRNQPKRQCCPGVSIKNCLSCQLAKCTGGCGEIIAEEREIMHYVHNDTRKRKSPPVTAITDRQ